MTFSRAFETSKPNAVIFVGDLLDEGGESTEETLLLYSRRFEHIFQPHRYKHSEYSSVAKTGNNDNGKKTEFIAYWGDNDVQTEDFLFPELYRTYRQKIMYEALMLGFDLFDIAPCRFSVDNSLLIRHFDPLLNEKQNPYHQNCKCKPFCFF